MIDFCTDCFAELPVLTHHCVCCAASLSPAARDDTVCGRCLAHPPAFDRVFAAFPYAPPIDGLIRELKFGQRLHCARLLSVLFAIRWQVRRRTLPDRLVPVPLHHTRLRRRGFNQSLEIARGLSHRLNVPIDARSLKRTRASVPQTALPAKQRLQNPKGTFVLRRALRVRSVALVDDVMTTGATANEAARVLKQAGVPHVEVWVTARTG